MVKHTRTIRRPLLTNYLSVFDHFVRMALKGFKSPISHDKNMTLFGMSLTRQN